MKKIVVFILVLYYVTVRCYSQTQLNEIQDNLKSLMYLKVMKTHFDLDASSIVVLGKNRYAYTLRTYDNKTIKEFNDELKKTIEKHKEKSNLIDLLSDNKIEYAEFLFESDFDLKTMKLIQVLLYNNKNKMVANYDYDDFLDKDSNDLLFNIYLTTETLLIKTLK